MKNLKMFGLMFVVFAAAVFYGSVGDVHAQRGGGSVEWSGTVDDTVQIRIRNGNVRTRVLTGRAYNNEDYNFNGREPRRNADVRVEKRDGRGRVYVVQQPNRQNNFTTIIQIIDSKGGADRYRFTAYWN
ncbi:MAG: hypothetical protein LH472_07315 [Pyrinomonadaceae bacterium]|nr:hypothetical protein [Pyrinomonadaceae bacterium]